MVKCPDKSNFKKKDLIMTKDSKLQSITAGKSKQQVVGADCLLASTAMFATKCLHASVQCAFFYCIVARIPHPDKGLTTVTMDHPISINIIRIISYRHYQRLTLT